MDDRLGILPANQVNSVWPSLRGDSRIKHQRKLGRQPPVWRRTEPCDTDTAVYPPTGSTA